MDLVGQRLDRGNDDRIAGVNPERVDVLHRAHGDARVVGIAHHLVLDLLPADEAPFDHDLVDRTGAQAGTDPLPVGRFRLDDPAAGAAQREGRPNNGRQPDLLERHVRGVFTLRGRQPFDYRARRVRLVDPIEQVAERLAILGHPDRLERRPEQADVVALEDTRLREGRGQVEGRLSAEAGKEAVRFLARNDGFDRFDGQRLEVDRVGDLRVGHDRGRVAVDEDRPDALRPEGAASLRAGVVELRRLADDDRPRPQDQDGGRLLARRGHYRALHASRKRSNTASASSGPGAPSGWYCTVSIGFEAWRSPSTEPSFRLTWLTWKPPSVGSESPTT